MSVYSLIASRRGAVAAEFTETETASLRSELTASVTGDAKVVKGEVGSAIEQSSSTETQVVRKSIVQATFKELREIEQDHLVIRPPESTDALPERDGPVEDPDRLAGLAATVWVTAEDDCLRGDLIELDVELEADPIFRVSTVITSLSEMLNESGGLFAGVDRQDVSEAVTINRVLTRLLTGLVPIRGRAVDYRVIPKLNARYIVHNDVIAQLPQAERDTAIPLIVVGVTERALFWKDVRRVLFSNAQYRLLCRLSRPGLQDSWTAVKLADVLGELDPNLKSQLDVLGEGALSAMSQATQRAQQKALDVGNVSRALQVYVSSVAERSGVTLNEDDLRHVGALAADNPLAQDSSIEGRRALFGLATEYLRDTHAIEIDALTAAQERTAATIEAGISPLSKSETGIDLVALAASRSVSALYLDTEVIAIYW